MRFKMLAAGVVPLKIVLLPATFDDFGLANG